MSKLINSIKAKILNKRAIDTNYTTISVTLEDQPNLYTIPYLQQVSFEAVFGAKYYVDEKLAQSSGATIQETLQQVKKAVVEEVFGEFRKPLIELRHAIYERDLDAAVKVLNKLEDQMFDV